MPIISNQPQQPLDPQQPVGRRERGTGFTNIGRLLGANVGAGQKMGQGIGTTLGSKAGQLKQDVSRAGEAFQQRYGESVGQAQDVFKDVSGLLPSSPTGIASGLSGMSEEQAKELGKKLGEAKTYKGPGGLEGQEQLGARAASIGGMGQLAGGGSYGQGLLLGSTAGKAKPYTRGQTALDTFLLGQSKEAQKAIREGAAQTYGAEQQAQTAIGGASQQAKEAAGMLGKQQADILKQASQSGQDISKYGEEQAKAYYADARRLQELMAKAGQVDSQTGKPLIDPATLSEKDKELIKNASQYGVDTSGTFVDPRERYAALSKNVLSNIAGLGDVSGKQGAMKLTGEQSSALKNLALLQQQESPTIDEFNTKLFPSEKSAYQASLDEITKEHNRALKDIENQISKEVAKTYGVGGHTKYGEGYDPDRTYLSSFWALNPAQKMTWIPGSIASNLEQLKTLTRIKPELLDPYIQKYAQQKEQETLAQKGITLGDYLKNLYGIDTPPQGGQV